MARKYYYPNKVDLQGPWHVNYATQVLIHGVSIGLVLADVTASANDSNHLAYAIGTWRDSAKNFGKGATGQVEVLKFGTGGTAFELPEFLPPAPPAGLTPVLPGALARIFKFVKMIKGAPGYTEGIGLLLGVVGEEIPLPPPPGESPAPELTAKIIAGTLNQYVSLKFYKRSHEYVMIESRRGTGDWEQIAQSNKSPCIDDRNLLVPGQAEVREYRARFWDNAAPTSDWCDTARITVGP